jgi:hypothetical protein
MSSIRNWMAPRIWKSSAKFMPRYSQPFTHPPATSRNDSVPFAAREELRPPTGKRLLEL